MFIRRCVNNVRMVNCCRQSHSHIKSSSWCWTTTTHLSHCHTLTHSRDCCYTRLADRHVQSCDIQTVQCTLTDWTTTTHLSHCHTLTHSIDCCYTRLADRHVQSCDIQTVQCTLTDWTTTTHLSHCHTQQRLLLHQTGRQTCTVMWYTFIHCVSKKCTNFETV